MSVSLLVLIRSLFAFLFLFLMARLMGKQQISQLTLFEYLVGITIGSIASSLSIELEIESINGIVGILVWGLIPILLAYLMLKNPRFRRLMQNEPTVLVRDGRILEKNLKKEKLHLDELMMLLRLKNCFNVADVEIAILETNGQLSVLPKSDKRPVQPSDLKLHVKKEQMPMTLVKDGIVNHQRLAEAGLNEVWLAGALKEKGIERIEDVLLAQIGSDGTLHVDKKGDWQKYSNPGLDRLVSDIERISANLASFALETKDEEMKENYREWAELMKKMEEKLKNRAQGKA
ncbi:DUF421 domain-containing protein [Bacillaceae bacterium]